MSQCVPSWELDESNNTSVAGPIAFSGDGPNADSNNLPDRAMLDYAVTELTWENGQLAMHGLGLPRPSGKAVPCKYAWEKAAAAAGGGETLESIVNQATGVPPRKAAGEEILPWFDHPHAASRLAMDALVPCAAIADSGEDQHTRVPDAAPRVVASSTRVGSCSGARKDARKGDGDGDGDIARKKRRAAASAAIEGSSRNQSVSPCESRDVTMDTCERDPSSQDRTTSYGRPFSSDSKPVPADDHDSVSRSRPKKREAGKENETKGSAGRSTISTRRSRAAAIHNQSERKRRDRINQRMKSLQKLVPNSSKTDKASMLDEVIDYLKQLQAQVQMMSKMSSLSQMMMPLNMQQLQMAMMAQMGMGLGMGMGMGVIDINALSRPTQTAALPPMLHPAAAFLPMPPMWGATADRLTPPATAAASVLPDPFASFLACQTQAQPMTLDAYSRMAALCQQLHQQQPPAAAAAAAMPPPHSSPV